MSTTSYTVEGMTCEHCVNAVRTEVGGIDGIHDVQVDLRTGTVTVTGDQPPVDLVHAAIAEAGFRVVS